MVMCVTGDAPRGFEYGSTLFLSKSYLAQRLHRDAISVSHSPQQYIDFIFFVRSFKNKRVQQLGCASVELRIFGDSEPRNHCQQIFRLEKLLIKVRRKETTRCLADSRSLPTWPVCTSLARILHISGWFVYRGGATVCGV